MFKQFKTYPALLLSMFLWGFSFVWFKEANTALKPMTIVFGRMIIATITLGLFLLLTNKMERIRKEDRLLLIGLAFCEPFLYFVGESNGLTLLSATAGSVLVALIPVFVALAAWIFLKEKLRLINYIGIVLSVIGIIIFVLNKEGELAYNTKGLLFMLLAVLSAVGYGVILGKVIDRYSPLFIVFFQCFVSMILFLPVFLIADIKELIAAPPSISDFIPVIKLSIFASITAFVLYGIATKNLGVTRANVFTNFIPVVTAILSHFILKEALTTNNIIGMVVVIIGLLLTQIKSKQTT